MAGVGTSGTFSGVARFLSERIPRLHRVAVEPQGSILGGGQRGPHAVEGIGLSFFPEILDRSLIDEVVTIDDADGVRDLPGARPRGGPPRRRLLGPRRGGGAELAERLGPGKSVVTLFPDGAERYPGQGIFGICD